ncbi:helix-turn-helix domain-containing protein [Streptomyces naphthomycinicus]|uniref:helix-turn-helix domain-containing protein n=1 Tax=Streptomyces naphthomycinicus TaxID=2872625 RepID=UPI001CEC09F1|nr:XRE family transcriptional regulator [Streptomyces sp. TML10]
MPRWKTLPEDLDPQIKEFTGQLRQLVDRSGLSVATLADRTGYSTTSWERYLGGRLLAPKGAVIALAEATGTSPVHLTTLWELAERTWSRAEMRHDRTMEAIRVSEARAALGDLGTATEPAGGGGASAGRTGRTGGGTAGPADRKGTDKNAGKGTDKNVGKDGGKNVGKDGGKNVGKDGGKNAGKDGGKNAGKGGGESAGKDGSRGADGAHGPADDGDTPAGRNSWGLAGYRGPSQRSARPGPRPPAGTADPAGTPAEPAGPPAPPRPLGATGTPGTSGASGAVKASGTSGAFGPSRAVNASGASGTSSASGTPSASDTSGVSGSVPSPDTPSPDGRQAAAVPRGSRVAHWSARRQQVTMFFAGLVGVLVLIAGVFLITHRGGGGHENEGAAKSPAPSARTRTSPPPGVKCTGSACTGKDAEAMGCSGDLVTTARTVALGTTTLEVRYSRACGTAWGRITSGAPGDTVRLTAGKVRQSGDITVAGDTIAYTPMIAVKDPAEARACATLASGRTGCTR